MLAIGSLLYVRNAHFAYTIKAKVCELIDPALESITYLLNKRRRAIQNLPRVG
jgi:hypothetical protein